MNELSHHIPADGSVTRNLVDPVNSMIRSNEPDSEVIRVALQGLFGIVGQLEAARRQEAD